MATNISSVGGVDVNGISNTVSTILNKLMVPSKTLKAN